MFTYFIYAPSNFLLISVTTYKSVQIEGEQYNSITIITSTDGYVHRKASEEELK